MYVLYIYIAYIYTHSYTHFIHDTHLYMWVPLSHHHPQSLSFYLSSFQLTAGNMHFLLFNALNFLFIYF